MQGLKRAAAPAAEPRRAVQYLRMSTEHQRYSLENQSAAIAEFATDRGFEIVRTYKDAGISGMTIEARRGLQELLADALADSRDFDAILVLDISRWGRFQDPDQSAHYEFICRQAGVEVHYCAEAFPNDGSMFASVAKTLKRAMAGEFLREISAKTAQAHRLQASMGFWQGGPAGYGLRRVMLDSAGKPVRVLEFGERKSIQSYRVVVAWGPPEELAVVKEMFRLFVSKKMTLAGVARQLNANGVPCPYIRGRWSSWMVQSVIDNRLFTGVYTYCRRTSLMKSKARARPENDWISVKVLPPLISERTFAMGQRLRGLRSRPAHTRAELLGALKNLLKTHGYLSSGLVARSRDAPSLRSYRREFGTLANALALIGCSSQRPAARGGRWSDEEILASLRRVHARHGWISARLFDVAPDAPSSTTVVERFGSIRQAYERAGIADPGRGPYCRASREEMLEGLRALWRNHGHISTSLIEISPGIPTPARYRVLFGSITEACRLAGVPATSEDLLIGRHKTRQYVSKLMGSGLAGPRAAT